MDEKLSYEYVLRYLHPWSPSYTQLYKHLPIKHKRTILLAPMH